MGAIALVFHAGLRRRWRSWLAIAILISVVGGLVLAAAAAGRRTESAFPRFVAAHGFDAVVYATRPVPGVAHLPSVASATELVLPDAGNPSCDCAPPDQRKRLRRGRPDGSGPVALHARLGPPARSVPTRPGVGVVHPPTGRRRARRHRDPRPVRSTVSGRGLQQPEHRGHPPPRVPTWPCRWSGSRQANSNFPPAPLPVYLLYAGSGFARSVLPHTAVQYQYYVRLRHGAAGHGPIRLSRSSS